MPFSSAVELGAIETSKETLRCNDSVAVLPLRSVLRETANGKLIPRPLPSYVNHKRICLAYRDEPIYSAPVKAFIGAEKCKFEAPIKSPAGSHSL